MSKLKQFGTDKEMVEQVKQSVHQYIDQTIVTRVHTGQSIAGYKEAADIFNSWLQSLLDQLTPPKKPVESTYGNAE